MSGKLNYILTLSIIIIGLILGGCKNKGIDELPVGIDEFLITTGNYSALHRQRHKMNGTPLSYIHHKGLLNMDIYYVTNNKIPKEPVSVNWGIVVWSRKTNLEAMFKGLAHANPDLQKHCSLKTEIRDGEVFAEIINNEVTQKLIESGFGDDLMFSCAYGTISCMNQSKETECQYRTNLKNGGGDYGYRYNDLIVLSGDQIKSD